MLYELRLRIFRDYCNILDFFLTKKDVKMYRYIDVYLMIS